MPANERLPEGTDSIIDDGGDVDRDTIVDETGSVLDDEDLDAPRAQAGNAGGQDIDGSFDADQLSSSTSGAGQQSAGTGAASFTADGLRSAFFGKVDGLKGDATDKAFAFAQTGKDRATSALDDVVRMVEDAAAEIDDKLGSQYGDYARRAAQGIGSFSDGFKDKPVEELFDDAKALIQKSPAIAVGAAAAIGFVIARVVRAGLPAGSDAGGNAPSA